MAFLKKNKADPNEEPAVELGPRTGGIFDKLGAAYSKKKEDLKGKKIEDAIKMSYYDEDKEFLSHIKPRRRYFFFSDYFELDDKFCTIMQYYHPEGADDKFREFWGIRRIALNIPDGVSIISFENVKRYTDGWITSHQSKAEGIVNMNIDENARNGGTTQHKMKTRAIQNDFATIASELQAGATYLGCTYRMLIKADSLEKLDITVDNIQQAYIERFGTLNAGSYDACQKEELSNILKHPDKQRGKPFNFTSTEFAGSYSLVTKGLDDKNGEYVGVMTDDVNNAAILFDVNGYTHHTVIANNEYDDTQERNPISSYWCSKISQSALIHNKRVVHMIFDNTNLDTLGPKFESITRKLNLSKGDINMFEMFGDPYKDNELSIFSEQLEKIALMVEQIYPLTPDQRGVTLGVLKEILEQYYIDNKMWFRDAAEHKAQIRVLGLKHKEYPKLAMFEAYINMEHKKANAATVKDAQRVEALGILRTAFKEMLDANGDLFNVITNSEIDDVIYAKRVLYDFSELMLRGNGLAMAQFVNTICYAVRSLKKGDVVILHGVENISNAVKPYVNKQFEALYRRGGRVVFSYDNIDKAFADMGFCKFDQADYTIFGSFTPVQVDAYQKLINQAIPNNLVRSLTKKGPRRTFIRRNGVNVLFNMDLILCNDAYKQRREQKEREKENAKGGRIRKRKEKKVNVQKDESKNK